MKRFSAVDLNVMVKELQEKVLNLRLQNIYDVSNKRYLFKFSEPEHKELLQIETGLWMHLTQTTTNKQISPSGFTMKLRSHLKSKRLSSIKQLGFDRIVEMVFGSGESLRKVYLEFYAAGNVVVCDIENRVLALSRVVREECLVVEIGSVYDPGKVRQYFPLTLEMLEARLESSEKIRKILSFTSYSPALNDHIIFEAGLLPSTKGNQVTMEAKEKLLQGFNSILNLLNESKGYIFLNEDGSYDKVQPLLYSHLKERKYIKFPSFNEAIDSFNTLFETQSAEAKERNQEQLAIKKLEAIKEKKKLTLEQLQKSQQELERKAMFIECNIDLVDKTLTILRHALASGMDWNQLESLIQNEKLKDNQYAVIISKLILQHNQVVLDLAVDEEVESVPVFIELSPYANVSKYHEMKKHAILKEQKSIQANEQALKSAERKIRQDLKQVKTTTNFTRVRKVYWFERFSWFISSENYLVIAGRDMQQNEQIVRRYMEKGDLYVHADMHGATSVLIKNPSCQPVPPSTLLQAGCMAICNSKAWDAKIVTSAWWVHSDQVSKTAPSGEYLSTGSFMIRGKKNFLPPNQLVYGFGLLFRVDDSCIQYHLDERKVKSQVSFEGNWQEAIEESSNAANSITQPMSEKAKDVKPRTQKTKKEVVKIEEPVKPKSTRGKKGKMKKIKGKYRHQDEEERELRLKFLGSAGKPDEEVSELDTQSTNIIALNSKSEKANESNIEAESSVVSSSVADSIAALNLTGDTHSAEVNEEKASVEVIDFLNLTGQPRKDDEILWAIPICAPFTTLQSYKYKVKLLPGTLKTGKACKLAMSMFLNVCDTEQEKRIIKNIPESELILQMMSKVKINAPNLEKVKNRKKKTNKN